MTRHQIHPVHTHAEVAILGDLVREYAAGLGIDLCFQGFDEELATLPGKYAPPEGAMLLARDGGDWIGCIALRPLEPGVCEMKRLYVRPGARGRGAGALLAAAIVAEARRIGYRTMRLDTLASMTGARAIYENLGFQPIAAYYANPVPDVCYYELAL